MRSIWTGAIGFGLVNIPIKLYSAVQESSIDLDMLDKRDHSNIRFVRVNEKSGKEVPWENIVKGYMMNDKYVVLTDKDFEAASPEKTKTINIESFVDEAEIDSMYFETPYYMEPDKSGARPYALLREALRKTGKAGIATFVMRNKEGLAMIRVVDDVLVLNRLRFFQEIRTTEDIKVPAKNSVKPAEMKMAVSLIDQLTEKFNLEKYKDEYNEKLLKFIKAKAKGVKVKPGAMRVVHKSTDDLMSQLKQSLQPRKKKAS